MSKAFTRESDDAPEPVTPLRPASSLPPGVKNYLTSGGEEKFRLELARLTEIDRPAVAALPAAEESRSRLHLIDQRILQLKTILETATVVQPPPPPHDQVRFGAMVTVRNRRGEELRYRIVGADETDLDRDEVSWLSPVARALLNARLGQRVKFRFPAGEDELEIVSISY